MDELDTRIMNVLSERGRSNVEDIVLDLARNYHIEYLRSKVRRHADSLTRYGFVRKTLVKRCSSRQSLYAYEVVNDD